MLVLVVSVVLVLVLLSMVLVLLVLLLTVGRCRGDVIVVGDAGAGVVGVVGDDGWFWC